MKLFILLIYLYFLFNIIESKNNNVNDVQVLDVQDIRIAQSHVIPIEGKQWILNNITYTLTVIPNRDSLILAKLSNINGSYTIQVYNENNQMVTYTDMKSPNELPPTEDNGQKYSSVHHYAKIEGQWIKKNMKIQFLEKNSGLVSNMFNLNIGIPRDALLWILPFYLFGANDTNSKPFSNIKQIDQSVLDELYQKWSLSSLDSKNHPMGKVDWPYLIMKPADNLPAMKITNADMKSSGYVIMNQVLDILKRIRTANGEDKSPSLIYTPLLHLGKSGSVVGTYGGLGTIGGNVCVGDELYTGIFIHELGHSWGMWHAEEAYNAKRYPYIKGSLKGSEWGYDNNHNEFLSIYVPKTAQYYPNCNRSFVLSDDGRCIKQSVMQGGAGDQSSKYRFSMFSDFEMTIIQKSFENSLFYRSNENKYQKWNSSSLEFYDYTPNTLSDGLYGSINQNTPIERDVDIYTLIFTYSTVGPDELNQFYPVIKSKGNLIKYYDNTNKTDIQDIIPFTNAKYHSYLYAEGSDYTLRCTFKDGSIKHYLLPYGDRKWGYANKEVYKDGLKDPKSSNSFKLFVMNVKADKELSLAELLYTPMAWNGIPDNVKVLASRMF